MARRYSVSAAASTNTVSTTRLQHVSAATIRPQIYDLVISSGATPADNAAEYQLKRFTAAGTVTAFAPVALDNGDPASLEATGTGGCGINATVEPTYTAATVLLDVAVNQRATFRWVARERSEIVMPATAANGVGLFVAAVGGSSVATTFVTLHEE